MKHTKSRCEHIFSLITMSLLRSGVQTRAQRSVSLQREYEMYVARCQPRFKQAVINYAKKHTTEHMVRFFELLFKYSRSPKSKRKPRDYPMDEIGPLLEANDMDSSYFAFMLSGEWQEWDDSNFEQQKMLEIDELKDMLLAVAKYLPAPTIYDTRF